MPKQFDDQRTNVKDKTIPDPKEGSFQSKFHPGPVQFRFIVSGARRCLSLLVYTIVQSGETLGLQRVAAQLMQTGEQLGQISAIVGIS
jgi:hypothetical protein